MFSRLKSLGWCRELAKDTPHRHTHANAPFLEGPALQFQGCLPLPCPSALIYMSLTHTCGL